MIITKYELQIKHEQVQYCTHKNVCDNNQTQ